MRQRSERVCEELRQFGGAQLLSVLAAVHLARTQAAAEMRFD
jgi:hypothetical protein